MVEGVAPMDYNASIRGGAVRDGFFEAMLWLSGWHLLAGVILFPAIVLISRSISNKRSLWALAAASSLVFIGLKWMQHFLFQNRAFDLGMYTNVVWNLASRGSYWDSITGINDLGDHFSPYLIALAPFMRIAPSDLWLSAFQSVGLIAGVFAVHRLAERHLGSPWALPAAALYLVHPRLHGIHFYDFHIIAFAVPCFLWILLLMDDGRWNAAMWLGLLALGIREDVALAVFGLGLYIAAAQKEHRWRGILLMAASIAWMALVQIWAMPYFLGNNAHSRNITYFFSYLGTNFPEAMQRMSSDPIHILRTILSDGTRLHGLAMYLVSFGLLPFLRPKMIWLWIMPVGFYFLSDYYNMNQFRFQYSALSFPFLFYVSMAALGPILRPLPAQIVRIAAAACISYALLFLPMYFRADTADHVRALNRLVEQVPPDAAVSAETHIVPRLASRSKIAMFPDVHLVTEYVALDTASPVLSAKDIRFGMDFARKFHDRIIFNEAGVYLLRNGPRQKAPLSR